MGAEGNVCPFYLQGPANWKSAIKKSSLNSTELSLPSFGSLFSPEGLCSAAAAASVGFSPHSHPLPDPRAGGGGAGTGFAPLCVFRKRSLFSPPSPF